MGSFEPTGLVKSFRGAECAITLWFPGGDLVAGRVEGYVRTETVTAAFTEIDRYAGSHVHPGRGFMDLTAMTSFEWEARMALLRWNVAHRLKASRMDVLSGSWIVQIALGALGTILGERLVTHESRGDFESAYAAALAQRAAEAARVSP